jgi:hypothetical protein
MVTDLDLWVRKRDALLAEERTIQAEVDALIASAAARRRDREEQDAMTWKHMSGVEDRAIRDQQERRNGR